MYVWEYIDEDELTRLIPNGKGSSGIYDVVDKYIDFFIETINQRLLKIKDENSSAGLFELVHEKRTSENEAKEIKNYCYDFHIRAKTVYGDFESRGYRIMIPFSSSMPKKADIGIRVTPTKEGEKKVWKGEKLSGTIGKGDFNIFGSYRITNSDIQAQKKPTNGFIEGSKNNKKLLIRGKAYILVTEHNLCIFSNKGNYPGNIISFLLFRHVVDEGRYLYLANGWRCNDQTFTAKSKRDKYFQSNKPVKPSVKPYLWFREIWLEDIDGGAINWFLPNVYNTNEERMQSASEMTFRHINQSVGSQEEGEAMNLLVNTFLSGSKAVLSFV